jgi:endonuclease/exonuclease/phosphatase family metal-dependent hydrolase
MSNLLRKTFIMLLLATLATAACADTLRVVNYNGLNLRGSTMGSRTDYFRTVMASINPDVAIFQEILDQDAVDNLLSFVFLQVNDDWSAALFHDGEDTDNAFFYRTSKVEFISQRFIETSLRDIAEYRVRPLAMDTSESIRFFAGHLKASDSPEDAERRRQECAVLRAQLDLLPEGSYFTFSGDFNLYTSEEPAYQLLLNPAPNTNGQLFDPIDSPGDWHESVSFAQIHTQSTRTTNLGDGGATGGLDDRFDFILVSGGLMDNQNTAYVIPESYKSWGNDGQHINQAINDGINNAVPEDVADALHSASDHLPVVADFVVTASNDAITPPAVAQSYVVLSCYPNPFNSRLTVDISGLRSDGVLRIFDVQNWFPRAMNFRIAHQEAILST